MKAEYAAAGIKVMISAFGSTDEPATSGADPVALGHKFASFVKQYDLDGIDVDFEDFPAIDKVSLKYTFTYLSKLSGYRLQGDGAAENWLVSFTKTLRGDLPSSDYIITHARE